MVTGRREPQINPKSLTDAIMNSVKMSEDERPDAELMAEHLLGFFGYQDRVIDNMLEPRDRNVFYHFQDWGLLSSESEETTLFDGREWRIHYWKLRTDRIIDSSFFDKEEDVESNDEVVDIYKQLPDEHWGIETYNEADSWLPPKEDFREY
ncbi:MAG: hypothetical protein QF460_00470 [Candidatus Nanoarchaeia archaeon]|jgi:hypothetical protein|nr:hypothetical protein [Candidatus Nanoarchaeia archaeon]|tara:strand:- start:768 stop:1220 length:453 start_codon:yes stop_codon:yes gene_type:complete